MSRGSENEQPQLGKKDEISALFGRLEANDYGDANSDQRETIEKPARLSRGGVLGRDPHDADEIFSKRGFRILVAHGLERSSPDEAALEALRCTANALLLEPKSRQVFTDLGFASKTSEKLNSANDDDCEFLFSRILFLLTYDTNLDFEDLALNFHLKDGIIKHLERHAKASEMAVPRPAIATMAISESLKLLFNITHYYPTLSTEFALTIAPILKILRNENPIPQPPLEPPVGHLINVLMNLDLAKEAEAVFPSSDPECNIAQFVAILDATITAYGSATVDSQATPLLSVMPRLYNAAPEKTKSFMKRALLPSDDERKKPLGRSETLPGRLLRLSTSARTPELRDSILGLLFDLSDRDAASFVKNVGYGYASGFLVNHNISTEGLFPPAEAVQLPAREGGRNREDGGSSSETRDVNFVTGQYIGEEPEEDGPEMSQEEKEREAEKLFVLFERLKKTGIVSVQNPVETAARSGQLEELE